MTIFTRSRLFVVLGIMLLCAGSLGAQTLTGTLTGNVSHQGAPLPGVTVTATSPALQGVRTKVTDGNGNYTFGALPPGKYQVVFEMEGMQQIARVVDVTLAGTARADAVLQLSSVAEAITVTASAPSVVEASEIQSNFEENTVENLPVNRTLVGTVGLAAGVNQNGPRDAVTISGAPSFDSTFYINGTPVNEVLRGQPLDLFIEDALQETTILTGAISAEYGRFTGGVVNAISKSGGNEFSGSLRDSLTNASWAESTPLEEDLLDKTNQTYEGTFGGRIIRDRLWFFTAGRYVKRNQQNFLNQSTVGYNTQNEQKRIEGKVTGQITPKHSLVGSFLNLDATITDRCLGGGGCWELQSLSQTEDQPQDLYSVNYNGILSNELLVEAFWSKSSLEFGGSGGPRGTPEAATPVFFAGTGGWAGASEFCSNCGNEVRESKTFGGKATYYLSTPQLGTHNIVGGYEEYTDSIFSNNHQSGSDFTIWTFNSQTRTESGAVLPRLTPGAGFVIWWPIVQDAQPNDIATRSVFVNDKWDLNNHWSFNLGGRYDKNDGQDSAGKTVADDSKISPRLGVTFDPTGNGRLRFNASYSEYVSKIANGNVADASSPAGSPSLLYWIYGGPTISGLPTDQFVAKVFEWFNSTGGTENRMFLGKGGFLLGGGQNGVQTQIISSLKSPSVREYAIGVGGQIGRNGFLRLDYQDRKWSDFYVTHLNLDTGTILDPLVRSEVDRGIVTNSDLLERKYRAVVVQGGYRFTPRLSLAGNYTWSKLRGNTTAETIGSGPIPETDSLYYPEIFAFQQNDPVGYLAQDQRHKARAWVSYDLPTRVGNFNLSVLERYDSGTPYSAVGTIDPISGGVENPGYLNADSASAAGTNYYFSDRGEFRWDTLTATDLGINYTLPISRVSLFFQGEILNVFNESAQIAGNTDVITAYDDPDTLELFNPFTDTPVEGVNWRKGTRFGEATSPASYQVPRTYRFSVGVKF